MKRGRSKPTAVEELYEAILHFEESDAAQEYYYRIMDTEMERSGTRDTVRNQILRVYAMLFCEELVASGGLRAGVEDVAATADLLRSLRATEE